MVKNYFQANVQLFTNMQSLKDTNSIALTNQRDKDKWDKVKKT